MQSEKSRRPGRLKPPNIPTSLDDSDSHLDEIRGVLDMLDTITTTTKDIVREAEGEGTASLTLARISALSGRLPDDILSFTGSTIPSFAVSLETYELILFDVRDRLIACHCVANDDVTIINRRLDLFIHEFEEKKDLLTTGRNKSLLPESANILQNSRNVTISGGIFNAIRQVVPDAAFPEQSHVLREILRVLNFQCYIQCGVLFA